MKLWVGRHGFAGLPEKDPKKERERPLLPEGKATVLAMAKAMGDLDEMPRVIFCSPFARTIMTADIYGKELGIQVNVIGDLAPMRPLEDTILGLIAHRQQKRVMIVGHVDNTTPAMRNLAGDEDSWSKLVMAEIRRVEISRKDGDWKLKWGMKPSDIGRKDHAT